jgi:hypothetical protein
MVLLSVANESLVSRPEQACIEVKRKIGEARAAQLPQIESCVK